ncbi:2733_t:CDS:1, partial [Gigaspora rosea]
ELRKFISDINSSDWKESTKPIITKTTKLIKEEKQESEADKINKIYEKQELEADKIQNMIENIMKIKDEKQESENHKIQKIYENQENFQKILEKIMKKLEIQSSEEH